MGWGKKNEAIEKSVPISSRKHSGKTVISQRVSVYLIRSQDSNTGPGVACTFSSTPHFSNQLFNQPFN